MRCTSNCRYVSVGAHKVLSLQLSVDPKEAECAPCGNSFQWAGRQGEIFGGVVCLAKEWHHEPEVCKRSGPE
jgi:surface antigen